MIQMYSDSPKQTPDIDFIVILKWKLSVAVFHCQGHLVPFGVSEMPAALTKWQFLMLPEWEWVGVTNTKKSRAYHQSKTWVEKRTES